MALLDGYHLCAFFIAVVETPTRLMLRKVRKYDAG